MLERFKKKKYKKIRFRCLSIYFYIPLLPGGKHDWFVIYFCYAKVVGNLLVD
jgi:hypothetical protein